MAIDVSLCKYHDHEYMGSLFFSSSSPQGHSGEVEGAVVRAAGRPATEKAALGVHLLSSHARDVPLLPTPPRPPCPARFQRLGGAPPA